MVRLDHANLSVRDIDAEVRFLLAAFPEFRVRHEGLDPQGERWVHVGNDDGYIALSQAVHDAPAGAPYTGRPGVNHIGFEVGDAAGVRERLLAGGYQETTVPNHHPWRTRLYFFDPEGNDWEFVEYRSDDPAKRHDYALG